MDQEEYNKTLKKKTKEEKKRITNLLGKDFWN